MNKLYSEVSYVSLCISIWKHFTLKCVKYMSRYVWIHPFIKVHSFMCVDGVNFALKSIKYDLHERWSHENKGWLHLTPYFGPFFGHYCYVFSRSILLQIICYLVWFISKKNSLSLWFLSALHNSLFTYLYSSANISKLDFSALDRR